jgi:hypothetical protein
MSDRPLENIRINALLKCGADKYIIDGPNAVCYDAPRRFIYIDNCKQCSFVAIADENGREFYEGDDSEGIDESDIWYYCRHKPYQHWPKRIGQIDKVVTSVDLGCPLKFLAKIPEVSDGKEIHM